MNRLLADILSFLNGLLAVGIVGVGALMGFGSAYLEGNRLVGLLIGTVLGFVVAGGVCGTIALLALIESHLRRLVNDGELSSRGYSRGRREPEL